MAHLVGQSGEIKVQYKGFKDFLKSKQINCRADLVDAWYDFKDIILYEDNSDKCRFYRR